MDIDAQITKLHGLREQIATLGKTLAHRELDARLLRLTTETQLRTNGRTQTAAEKEAKVDESYLAYERETAVLFYDRELLIADAEAESLSIRLQLAVLERVGV